MPSRERGGERKKKGNKEKGVQRDMNVGMQRGGERKWRQRKKEKESGVQREKGDRERGTEIKRRQRKKDKESGKGDKNHGKIII